MTMLNVNVSKSQYKFTIFRSAKFWCLNSLVACKIIDFFKDFKNFYYRISRFSLVAIVTNITFTNVCVIFDLHYYLKSLGSVRVKKKNEYFYSHIKMIKN